jgi:hypothetical protein
MDLPFRPAREGLTAPIAPLPEVAQQDVKDLVNDTSNEQATSKCSPIFIISELLELILSFLPFVDMYKVQRVCWFWKECITSSRQLKRLMFKEHAAQRFPQVSYGRLTTEPVFLNPILSRTIIISDPDDPFKSARLTSRDPSSPTERYHDLYEDVLETEPYTSAEQASPDIVEPGKQATATPRRLLDHEVRPLATSIRVNRNGAPLPSGCEPHGAPQIPSTERWKDMKLTSAPIHCLVMRRRGDDKHMAMRCNHPLRLADLLWLMGRLEKFDPQPKPLRQHCELEIGLLLGMKAGSRFERYYADESITIWRPMKTSIRICLQPSPSADGVAEIDNGSSGCDAP